jgi:hypothetical protein
MEKSANKKWKESGSTLTFKEWIDRENKKNESSEQSTFIPFDGVPAPDTSSINDTLRQAQDEILVASGYKTQPSKTTVFGLDKNILIFSGILLVSSIVVYFYLKSKKK